MLDLGPEKLLALLTIGLVVLGPQRLPGAARSLATGLARARQLAQTLTEPVQAQLAEPRQALEDLLNQTRSAVPSPADLLGPTPQAADSGVPSRTPDTHGWAPRLAVPADPTHN